MNDKVVIAIDAMGGENAPKKNIEGLGLFLKRKLTKLFKYAKNSNIKSISA